eukprot:PhM_4_TR13876/c0_g1_i1/m.22566
MSDWLVIDHGSFQLRAGRASHDVPELVTYEDTAAASFGVEFLERERDTVPGLSDGDCKVHVSIPLEAALSQTSHRAYYYFEEMRCSNVHFSYAPTLAMYSTGLLSCLAVDVGYAATRVTSILDGVVQHAYSVSTPSLCGRHLDQFFPPQITANGRDAHVAKTMGVIPAERGVAFTSSNPITYNLPDGTSVDITPGIAAVERELFHTTSHHASVPDLVRAVTASLPLSQRGVGASSARMSTVLFGGLSGSRGFLDRFQHEMLGSTTCGVKYHTQTGETPELMPWIGAAILAQLKSFQDNAVTRAEYDENGAEYVQRKCMAV